MASSTAAVNRPAPSPLVPPAQQRLPDVPELSTDFQPVESTEAQLQRALAENRRLYKQVMLLIRDQSRLISQLATAHATRWELENPAPGGPGP